MEKQISVVIVGVTSKQVTRKSDSRVFTLYEVACNDGNTWTTGKQEIAEQAHKLTGQGVVLDVKEEQDGQYMKRYLNAVHTTTGNALGGGIPSSNTPAEQPGITPQAQESPQETRESIHRQKATAVAQAMSSTPAEFWDNVRDLKAYYDTGNPPGAQATTTVAADDDIPF